MRTLCLLGLTLLALGCKDPGDPCTVTDNGGQPRDPCGTRCLDEPMNCPDGAHTNPGVCAGSRCEGPADCAEGWLCLPYEQQESVAYCAPAHVCGE